MFLLYDIFCFFDRLGSYPQVIPVSLAEKNRFRKRIFPKAVS